MPSTDWTPSLAQVAEPILTRTRDRNGVEQGTFTIGTKPTAVQATAQIATAVEDVASVQGTEIDGRLWGQAKRVTALRAAMLIELTYYPEQVAAGRSPYPHLKELYQEGMVKLGKAIQELASGDQLGPGDDPAQASFAFPADAGGLVGWSTRW